MGLLLFAAIECVGAMEVLDGVMGLWFASIECVGVMEVLDGMRGLLVCVLQFVGIVLLLFILSNNSDAPIISMSTIYIVEYNIYIMVDF